MHLVHQLAHADWFLQRSIRTVAEVEAQMPSAIAWTDDHHKNMARFLRYQTTRNNMVIKRQKAVEDYRKNRAAEVTRAQAVKDKAEKLAIAQAKLKSYQTKTRLSQAGLSTWKACAAKPFPSVTRRRRTQ